MDTIGTNILGGTTLLNDRLNTIEYNSNIRQIKHSENFKSLEDGLNAVNHRVASMGNGIESWKKDVNRNQLNHAEGLKSVLRELQKICATISENSIQISQAKHRTQKRIGTASSSINKPEMDVVSTIFMRFGRYKLGIGEIGIMASGYRQNKHRGASSVYLTATWCFLPASWISYLELSTRATIQIELWAHFNSPRIAFGLTLKRTISWLHPVWKILKDRNLKDLRKLLDAREVRIQDTNNDDINFLQYVCPPPAFIVKIPRSSTDVNMSLSQVCVGIFCDYATH